MANPSPQPATRSEPFPGPRLSLDDPGPSFEAELMRRISECAYLKAEQRGFEPGHEMDDWLAAEAEVRAALASEGN
ncbi:Protein of unknown function [Methylomagnum ishizawai]|uniref:DUF2934 domain-containing protein n=1 Tax=Methylomagnum ishizawai TaxID=1760988 RepID=A0A1Y6D5T6_9GAMM|nr:DUF2934 domain-containing protein [Methylomagnum ishizawai]SMF97800.1 Protein of unknown function [Methylomagnum ishizawai]